MWVKVFDVSDGDRNEDSMRELAKTFGRHRLVDLKSLSGKGLIRVRVDCRNPRKLRGRIEIFLNVSGFKFRNHDRN
jgi:hypothetical protein